MKNINIRKCDNWYELPEVWKEVKKIRPIEFKDDITDKNLLKIVQDYFSIDELRPAMTGAFVDKNSITVTDAHKLISIPFSSSLPEGVYRMNPKSKNTEVKMYGEIKEKFPQYKNILKTFAITHKISAYKLKTYCQAAIKGKYTNQVTNQIVFKYDSEKNVSFNGKFLIEVLDSFLLMGYDELYVSFSGGGLYLSPNQETTKNPVLNIGKFPFALIMETMGSDVLGARDIDFDTELNAYYCFECDKIFNADGSVAKFDIALTDPKLGYISEENLKLAERMLPKNFTIPICENVMVKDTVLYATNLDHFLAIKNVNVGDGIYEIVNGAFKNTTYSIEDYPVYPEIKNTQLAEFDTFELSQRVSQSIPFLGNDDIRENLNGLCLRLKDQSDIVATNAHILIRADIQADMSEKNEYLIKEPKFLSYFLNSVTDDRVKMYGTSDKLNFVCNDLSYITRTIDARIPNYDNALDRNINSVFEFDSEALMQVLSSLKGEEAKKNIYFDFVDKDNGYFNLKLSEQNYGSETKIVKDLNIKIGCDIRPITNNPNLSSLCAIMPINTGSKNFSFNIKYLKTILSVSDGIFYFDDRKDAPMFIAELPKVEPKTVKSKPKELDKSEIEATIDALQFLADSGNEDAKNTIESLKLLK